MSSSCLHYFCRLQLKITGIYLCYRCKEISFSCSIHDQAKVIYILQLPCISFKGENLRITYKLGKLYTVLLNKNCHNNALLHNEIIRKHLKLQLNIFYPKAQYIDSYCNTSYRIATYKFSRHVNFENVTTPAFS